MSMQSHVPVDTDGDPPDRLTHRLTLPDDGYEDVTGRLIGFASSRRERHSHPGLRFAPIIDTATNRRAHCTACRWFEVRIIIEDPDTYVVHTKGGSAVPGDQTYSRLVRTTSAFEVIELLTNRRGGGAPTLPGHSARALAQAAGYDDALQDAYLNRAVA